MRRKRCSKKSILLFFISHTGTIWDLEKQKFPRTDTESQIVALPMPSVQLTDPCINNRPGKMAIIVQLEMSWSSLRMWGRLCSRSAVSSVYFVFFCIVEWFSVIFTAENPRQFSLNLYLFYVSSFQVLKTVNVSDRQVKMPFWWRSYTPSKLHAFLNSAIIFMYVYHISHSWRSNITTSSLWSVDAKTISSQSCFEENYR